IYMNASTWYQEKLASGSFARGAEHGAPRAAPTRGLSAAQYIAYFSAEFGISESLPIYSGGLGVLAGDHLQAASDLGIPLVGVGLPSREGYSRQSLNIDGWQQERYPENDFFHLPLIPETREDGSPLLVGTPFPGREVQARVWRIQVGRVPLYLLDTNI